MFELIYEIDKELSFQTKSLVVRIRSVEKKGSSYLFSSPTPISKGAIQKLATDKDRPVLSFLFDQKEKGSKNSDDIVQLPYSKSMQALKSLAATGKLFFNQHQLACDFFGKVEFFYFAASQSISGRFKIQGGAEFDVRECDFVCGGPPHWFIKGIMLRFVGTDISWKRLKDAYDGAIKKEDIPLFLEDMEEENSPKVIFDANISHVPQAASPFPVLKLKDRHGGFADLWMDYGENRLVHFHDSTPQSGFKRQIEQEKSWEKDLLETGFSPKFLPNSHYYCPLDKVGKSLAFLLELGWKIKDWQDNDVLNHSQINLSLDSLQNLIYLRGKVQYDTHEVDLANIAGAFNRREKFIQISPGTVGLLPSALPQGDLGSLVQECEIVSDALTFKRCQIGSLSSLFENKDAHIKLNSSFEELKTKLASFEAANAAPGPSFQGALRPYQQEGLNWLNGLYELGLHGMLADDMGLGKTVQVLAFLSRLNWSKPVLIVLPTSLLFNWKKEIELFLPSAPVLAFHGSNRSKEDLKGSKGIILTSYATLRIDLEYFLPIEFEIVILDEAQVMKNASSLIAKSIFQLHAALRISLTGTPIENNLQELWSHFHFLIPELLGEEKDFNSEVQAGLSDARYLFRIKRKIRPFLLRRKKEEVAKDLPEKIEQTVWLEMEPEQRRFYEDFLAGVKNNLLKKVALDGIGKHRMEVLESILCLRQICCHPDIVANQISSSPLESSKMNALIEDLETVLKENRKALIYSQFTSMLGLIAKVLKEKNWNFVYLDGQTKQRESVVAQFQNDPDIPFFLISLKAGGVGLNLTAADYVFLYDPWWNDAAENQAIDRAHRIGRNETVIAKRYVMAETIEEKIMKLKAMKKSLVDGIVSDEFSDSRFSEEDLLFLLT